MSKLLQDVRDLHRAPGDWSLDTYAPHAWRVTRNLWLFMIGFSVVGGVILPPRNPARLFDEWRPFTIYTVILLGICGVVCAQCTRLARDRSRGAWALMAIGFWFLALDDLIQIHEELDRIVNHAVGLDPNATLPDLLDAGIVVLYGIAGVLALFYYRRRFFRFTGFTTGIARAAAAAVAMVILDVLGELVSSQVAEALVGILEDSFEALAVSYFFWTFVTARFQLRREAAAGVARVSGVKNELER